MSNDDNHYYDRIPPLIRESLDRYAEQHIPVGGFLRAVLTNDLFGAVGKADHGSFRALREITSYVFCRLPMECWGSEEAYLAWLEKREG